MKTVSKQFINGMGKLKCFEILWTENKSVFYPGERVSGCVVLDLKKDVKLRSLRIFLRGVAKVHWTESRNTGTRLGAYTEHYNAEVEYFFKRQVLFGGEVTDGRDHLLEAGHHDFNFTFDLPMSGISTSFEGKHGNIRYWVKAEIDKPWSFNHKTKKAFTVISPIDINRPEYMNFVESSVEKTLCCWFCTSGPVSITARTDRRGYCPGESIQIFAEFSNHSSRTVTPHATLYQSQIFFAGNKSKLRRTKFCTISGAPVYPGGVGVWESQEIEIPAVSPTIRNCCILKVKYFIEVSLHIPGSQNLALQLPIVIGTVPYRQDRHPPTSLQTGVQLSDISLLPAPPPYSESIAPPPFGDPPTYRESVEGAVSILDDDDDPGQMGSVTFTPMYTYVYDYRRPPAYSENDPHPVH
ncbi:arrestin domain-containing protein 3-like [Saccostrea echinata]|uniref:arrestin domain-containing protein 3-like n=1 Tax=Saccostrea echinata TaxID=191078 RepID=UPI002A7F57CD|nr:arrestin domain-containing protein 3-like [Saccostrea echinata]